MGVSLNVRILLIEGTVFEEGSAIFSEHYVKLARLTNGKEIGRTLLNPNFCVHPCVVEGPDSDITRDVSTLRRKRA